MRRSEVDHLRTALPDVYHIAARLREPPGECLTDRRARETDIVPYRHTLCSQESHESPADTIGQRLIHFRRIDPANVISPKAEYALPSYDLTPKVFNFYVLYQWAEILLYFIKIRQSFSAADN